MLAISLIPLEIPSPQPPLGFFWNSPIAIHVTH